LDEVVVLTLDAVGADIVVEVGAEVVVLTLDAVGAEVVVFQPLTYIRPTNTTKQIFIILKKYRSKGLKF
jgi:hypothetical protein